MNATMLSILVRSSNQRVASLDGLRAVSILLVVASHLGLRLRHCLRYLRGWATWGSAILSGITTAAFQTVFEIRIVIVAANARTFGYKRSIVEFCALTNQQLPLFVNLF